MNRELLQQALDMINAAIKSGDWKVDGACDPDSLIRGLKAELALDRKADNARELGLDYEPEQEPFAWVARHKVTGDFIYSNTDCNGAKLPDYFEVLPVYLAPPRKEWIWLTDEQLGEIRGRVQNHTSLDDPNYGKRVQYATLEWLNYPELTRKEWVGLTDAEIINAANSAPFADMDTADDYIYVIARAIEAKLKEKNNAV